MTNGLILESNTCISFLLSKEDCLDYPDNTMVCTFYRLLMVCELLKKKSIFRDMCSAVKMCFLVFEEKSSFFSRFEFSFIVCYC